MKVKINIDLCEAALATVSTRPPSSSPLHRRKPDPAGATPCASGERIRCGCGSLLARYVGGGIELKCRRCKSTMIVPIEGKAADDD
jgi:hypothetical protein